MDERQAFTTHQWQALLDAAPAIARAVAAIAGSTGESRDELGAFIDLVARTDADASGGLLGAVVSDLYGRLAGGLPEESPADPYVHGIEAARRAGAILATQADPAEAQRVAAWLLFVAQTVAGAGREGGLLGIGGERVSEHENEAIAAIRDALGLTEAEGS